MLAEIMDGVEGETGKISGRKVMERTVERLDKLGVIDKNSGKTLKSLTSQGQWE